MDQTPDNPPENQQSNPAPRAASFLQRVIEHALSFVILAPAMATFFGFLLMMFLLIPSSGPADGIVAAFAVSTNFLKSAYVIGAVPSLLVGAAIYPLSRRLSRNWQLYPLAALINAPLCAIVFTIIRGISGTGIVVVAFLSAIATGAAVFLTRKLRL